MTCSPRQIPTRAGVVAVRCDRRVELFEVFRAGSVDIGPLIGAVRIDPHGFNVEDDIKRFLTVYDGFRR